MAMKQFDPNEALNSISMYAPKRSPLPSTPKKKVKPKKSIAKPKAKVTKPAPKKSTAENVLKALVSGANKASRSVLQELVKGTMAPIDMSRSALPALRAIGKGFMQPAEIGRDFDNPYEEFGNTLGNFPGSGLAKAAPLAVGVVGKSGDSILKSLMRQGVKKTSSPAAAYSDDFGHRFRFIPAAFGAKRRWQLQ